jgi:glucan phosphoethanolaminetransferase (alkaline phosphatase superfamily)
MNGSIEKISKPINWSAILMFTLGFWLSGSLIFDFVTIPSLLASGMMGESGFASAAYLMFGLFNRIELVCGALVLTSCFVFFKQHDLERRREIIFLILASVLLAIALSYTYIFTPQMTSLGLQLNLLEPTPELTAKMASLHRFYWLLEGTKLAIGTILLRWRYRSSCSLI